MRSNMILVIMIVGALGSGCGLFEGESELEITSDRTSYDVGSDIVVRAKNNSSDVIYYNSCMPTLLQELSNGDVKESIGFPTCACLCVTELQPGKTWEWSVNTQWLWQNQGVSQPKIGPRYQFRFEFFRDRAMEKLINPSELLSNTFRFESDVAPTAQ